MAYITSRPSFPLLFPSIFYRLMLCRYTVLGPHEIASYLALSDHAY